MEGIITEKEFKENPRVFIDIDEAIKDVKETIINIKLKGIKDKNSTTNSHMGTLSINELRLDALIKLRNLNRDYFRSLELTERFEELREIKKYISDNPQDYRVNEIGKYHYSSGINVDPNQNLVINSEYGHMQTYFAQLEFDEYIENKTLLKKYARILIDCGINNHDSNDDDFIDNNLDLILFIGKECSELKNKIISYELKTKPSISESIFD